MSIVIVQKFPLAQMGVKVTACTLVYFRVYLSNIKLINLYSVHDFLCTSVGIGSEDAHGRECIFLVPDVCVRTSYLYTIANSEFHRQSFRCCGTFCNLRNYLECEQMILR